MKIVHFLSRFKHLKKKLGTSWRAFCDPRTPLSAKLILSLAILGYVIMPLDAIPDFIVFF